MRIPALPIIASFASFALLAAPAFAQNSSMNGATKEPGVATSANTGNHTSGVTRDARQRLIQSLDQSGFKNVRVTAGSFVIHAQAPDGSNLVMQLGPDEMTGVIQQSRNASEPKNATESGSSSPPSSLTKSGTPSSQSGTTH